jgi:hypothetical protein
MPAPTPCAFCGEPIDPRDRSKITMRQTVFKGEEPETGNWACEPGPLTLVVHEICGAPTELGDAATDGRVAT